MTLEYAINLIKSMKRFQNLSYYDNIACDLACDAIREKMERDRPHPINIAELKSMANQPILFVKIIGDCKDFTHTWVLMFGYEKSNGNFLFTNSVGNQHLYNEKDYGKTWLAYKTEGEKFN